MWSPGAHLPSLRPLRAQKRAALARGGGPTYRRAEDGRRGVYSPCMQGSICSVVETSEARFVLAASEEEAREREKRILEGRAHSIVVAVFRRWKVAEGRQTAEDVPLRRGGTAVYRRACTARVCVRILWCVVIHSI
jgi:hypothetical protein